MDTSDLHIQGSLSLPSSALSWSFSRAGGPGGQHVNTTDSRVQLRVSLASCPQIAPPVLERLRAQQPHWFTKSGDLLLTCAQHRSRHRNIELVKERLVTALQKALVRPKTRRPTRPSRASQRRRVKSKKERGAIKRTRGRVRHDD